ncbi:MAG TPA: hypothetical protein VFZ59_18985, partial [Verrucomicrobiae bacterium]|nr:hypothetical protein [Verrucomicrobiae bacterium]
SLKQLLAAASRNAEREARSSTPGAGVLPGQMVAVSTVKHDDEPGVVLDYLIVNQALLNVNFASYNKAGPAAIGQESWDYWNTYDFREYSSAALSDLQWSDYSGGSDVGIVVSNAPGVGSHSLIEDGMYNAFVYGSTSARLTVTITNLPANVYDLLVYAPRTPVNGSPVVELKRDGTTLWIKNLSPWGSGWHSPVWEDGEQYVRFRDIAVTNQTLRLEVIPDAAGYTTLSGLQIAPAGAVASEQPLINKLLNVDIAVAHSNKTGVAVIGVGSSDVWNHYNFPGVNAASLANLKWSDNNNSSAGLVMLNGAGQWGNLLSDVMFRGYNYAQNQGNITVTLTNLPSGNYDILAYGHTTTLDDNGVFEVWSDEINWGIKGTSLQGYGPTSNKWELGQQYVRLAGVAVNHNRPVYLQSKKTTYGYNNLSGLQIVRTGDLDTDSDGLPDAWEMKWFSALDYDAATDYDYDGLTNLREYQLGLFPTRADTDGDGIVDWQDNEFPWLDDSTPQGALLYTTSETWNWQTSWSDGVGWNGGTVTPHSGTKFHLSANVPNALHQHYFERALGVTRARTGDVFYAYVNLDPTYPPAEVMLQFYVLENNGAYSFEHRAYWGANHISAGVNGTMSRTNLGALPDAGQWVRLEVPASAVGLEGRIVEGMAFTLYGGRAAWDSAGVVVPDMDGDGVADIDADGLPDPWEFEHFGNLSQPATGENGDYDNDGVTNLEEYLNGTNPNTLWFDTHYANLYVSNRVVSGNVAMRGGHPYQIALLVNSTNLGTAPWASYTSNFNATLPDSDGNHTVLVALRGLSTNFPPYWDETELTLDRVPPVVAFTNPAVANATVIKPYLQLQGYANEPLVTLAYDLTNAAGLFTNEIAAVVDQYFDTNAFDFTTNYFQAYDVELTNGVNEITLTVSDRAGNVTVTNIGVTLDYTSATNPPTMHLLWPTNGMHLSGDSFYLRGLINDETAQLLAQLVDTNGVTNEITGIVERNGMFWVEGLPLASGTNDLTLIATDSAGNVSSTNLSVVKSSVTLTITSTPTGESLYTPNGTVSGTVSDTNYSVTVNGVAATVDEYGYWTAQNVPVMGQGTATFDAVADVPGGGTPSTSVSDQVEMPAHVAIVYHEVRKGNTWNGGLFPAWGSFDRTKRYTAEVQAGPGRTWTTKVLGTCTDQYEDYYLGDYVDTTSVYQWTTTNRSTHYTDNFGTDTSTTNIVETYGYVTAVPDRDIASLGGGGAQPIFIEHYFAQGVNYWWPYGEGGGVTARVGARTKVKLFTGGKAGVNRKNLFQITASAATYGSAPHQPWLGTPITIITDPTAIKVNGRVLGNDGRLWLALPDNSAQDLTVTVAANHYTAGASALKHKLEISANGYLLAYDRVRPLAEYCVGQKVSFQGDFFPAVPGLSSANPRWNFTGVYINHHYSDANDCERYVIAPFWITENPTQVWYYNKGDALNANLGMFCTFDNGQTAFVTTRGKFRVHRPSLKPLNLASSPQVSIWAGNKLGLDSNSGNGMGFLTHIDSEFDGVAAWTQLINGYYVGFTAYDTDGNDVLDGDEIYPFPGPTPYAVLKGNWIASDLQFADAPWITCSPNPSEDHMAYKTFARFRPNIGDPSENIYVTLGIVNWRVDAKANYDGSEWLLDPSSAVSAPSLSESIFFPEWEETY